MRRFDDEDLTGAEFRECDLSRTRLVGVVMQDAEIDGLITNLVVNGVEVTAYVEAELDRRLKRCTGSPTSTAARMGSSRSARCCRLPHWPIVAMPRGTAIRP